MSETRLPWYRSLFNRVSGKWVLYAVTLIGVALLSRLGIDVPRPDTPDEPIFAQGWINAPEDVARVVEAQPFKSFSETPAGQAFRGDEDAFLWKAWLKVLGRLPEPRNQRQVGSCVGFGTSSAIACLLAVQIAEGDAKEYADLVEEVTYGGSRVEVGGGRIRGDGSVGAWAAQFVERYGVIGRGKHLNYELQTYSEQRCREWGQRGVPDDLEQLVKKNPVKGVVLVKNAEEAKKALQQGYPIAVCSNQGFSSQRDADGFARAQGSWAHCMCVLGYQGGERPGFFVWNSWGSSYHKGPLGKGEPPEGGFWCEWSTMDRMLKQGDSWAFSDLQGFPARKLDWLLMDHLRPHQEVARKERVECFALAP